MVWELSLKVNLIKNVDTGGEPCYKVWRARKKGDKETSEEKKADDSNQHFVGLGKEIYREEKVRSLSRSHLRIKR